MKMQSLIIVPLPSFLFIYFLVFIKVLVSTPHHNKFTWTFLCDCSHSNPGKMYSNLQELAL